MAPRTVDDIFNDYQARRTALLHALTRDVDELYSVCDPAKENLCLFGHPDESWEVVEPAEEIPPEIPEPVLGINFARDGMSRKDWLSLVAEHSDSWLLSVAFCFGATLNKNERKRLFNLINDFPTLSEVVKEMTIKDKPTTDSDGKPGSSSKRSNNGHVKTNSKLLEETNGVDEQHSEDKPTANRGRKSGSSLKRSNDGHVKTNSKLLDESSGSDGEQSETCCGSCGGNDDNSDEFWIYCDLCGTWYHGKCVKITPAKAKTIEQYKCPSCNGE